MRARIEEDCGHPTGQRRALGRSVGSSHVISYCAILALMPGSAFVEEACCWLKEV